MPARAAVSFRSFGRFDQLREPFVIAIGAAISP
jgi:hypothetical protein